VNERWSWHDLQWTDENLGVMRFAVQEPRQHRCRTLATESLHALLFCGRGYCQITGRFNYHTFSGLTGVDLLATPDRALEPSLTYQIASAEMRHEKFCGVGLAKYINETTTKIFSHTVQYSLDIIFI
jgi:hypothetical protein